MLGSNERSYSNSKAAQFQKTTFPAVIRTQTDHDAWVNVVNGDEIASNGNVVHL